MTISSAPHTPPSEPVEHPGGPNERHHGDELGAYIKVFVALLVLLICTYGAYFIPFEKAHIGSMDLGFMNTVVALIIATVKACLVMLVFMHLRHSTKLTWVIAASGFFFLSIMILFTFIDYQSRSSITENTFSPPTRSNESMVIQQDSKQLDQTMGW